MSISSRKSDVKKVKAGARRLICARYAFAVFFRKGFRENEEKYIRSFVQVFLSVSSTPTPPAGGSCDKCCPLNLLIYVRVNTHTHIYLFSLSYLFYFIHVSHTFCNTLTCSAHFFFFFFKLRNLTFSLIAPLA